MKVIKSFNDPTSQQLVVVYYVVLDVSCLAVNILLLILHSSLSCMVTN